MSVPDPFVPSERPAPDRNWWRYYFAGQALPALLAMNRNALEEVLRTLGKKKGPLRAERAAVHLADALLAKLESEEAKDA